MNFKAFFLIISVSLASASFANPVLRSITLPLHTRIASMVNAAKSTIVKKPEFVNNAQLKTKSSLKGIVGGFAGGALGIPLSIGCSVAHNAYEGSPLTKGVFGHHIKGIVYSSLACSYILGGAWGVGAWLCSIGASIVHMGNNAFKRR